MTGFGVIFLPLCLYFWRTPARLLELVMVGSVFAAAAAIALGSYGVTPGLVPSALFEMYFVLTVVNGERFPAERIVGAVLLPFLAVVTWALVSSIMMPRLYEGDILVWPQKVVGLPVQSPLAPSSGNYTQDMYLIVNAALLVLAAVYLTRDGFNLRRLLDAYFVSGLIACAVALWQFAHSIVHVPFPSNFFLSNPGWALLSDQTVGSLTRLNGTFSEPSSLAGYLCGSVSAAAWVIFNGDPTRLPRVLLAVGLLVILLCTSTTGYAVLAIMTGMLLLRSFLAAAPQVKKRVAAGVFVAGGIGAFAMVLVPIASPRVAQQAEFVFTSTLNKKQSDSYVARAAADHDSVRAMIESEGLGVGWGSSRSSSLLPGLSAGIGVWGLCGLGIFAGVLARHLSIAHRLATEASDRLVMHGAIAGVLGILAAAFLSGPTISSPDFYLLLALAVATGARVRFQARAAESMSRKMTAWPARRGPSAVKDEGAARPVH